VRDDLKLTGVDPKVRIEISNLLHDAMLEHRRGELSRGYPATATLSGDTSQICR